MSHSFSDWSHDIGRRGNGRGDWMVGEVVLWDLGWVLDWCIIVIAVWEHVVVRHLVCAWNGGAGSNVFCARFTVVGCGWWR